MSNKKKQKRISSEARTCFIFSLIFIVLGIGAIIYGKKFYHSDNIVSLDDIVTGQTATIISVEKRERNLSNKEQEDERKQGHSDNEIKWEYSVIYSVDAEGTEYTYDDIKLYRDGENAPHIGDEEIINYTIRNGEFIPNPETQDTNNVVICGWGMVILAIIAAGVGLFLRK